MKLKSALALASKYIGEDDMAVVSMREGFVQATNGHSGVRIACDAAQADCATPCKELLKILKALPDDAEIKKSRKLMVTSPSVSAKYALPTVRQENEPWFPAAPEAGWAALTEEQALALASIADGVDRDPHQRFRGMRLSPHNVLTCSNAAVIVAWVPGLVTDYITAASELFDSPVGAMRVAVDGRRVFVVDSEGTLRWAQALDAEYPDAAMQDMIVTARGLDARRIVIAPSALIELCDQASAVEQTRASVFALTVDGNTVTLKTTHEATVGFEGSAKFEGTPCSLSAPVGVRPSLMKRALTAVRADRVYFAVGRPTDPVTLTGGAVPVEALVMPSYLPVPATTPTE